MNNVMSCSAHLSRTNPKDLTLVGVTLKPKLTKEMLSFHIEEDRECLKTGSISSFTLDRTVMSYGWGSMFLAKAGMFLDSLSLPAHFSFVRLEIR